MAILPCQVFVTLWEARWRAGRKEEAERSRIWRWVRIEKDGTPRVHITRDCWRTAEITELDGTLVATAGSAEAGDRASHRRVSFSWGEEAKGAARSYRPGYRWFRWGDKYPRGWYFLSDVGWIVHYDQRTRLPDVYISPSGLHDSPPGPEDRFKETPDWLYLSEERDEIWKGLDTGEKLFVFREEPPHEMKAIYSARTERFDAKSFSRRSRGPGTSDRERMFAVLDGNSLLVMDTEGRAETALEVPEDMLRPGRTELYIADTDAGPLVVRRNAGGGEPNRALVFDGAGAKLAEHEWEDPPEEETREEVNRGRRTAIAIILAFFPVAAGICLWHARRHSLAPWKTVAWTVFAFLTGPMGAAVYFGVQDFAPLVGCPSCGKRRPADREECPRCGAAFAPPERTGIEIIDPVS